MLDAVLQRAALLLVPPLQSLPLGLLLRPQLAPRLLLAALRARETRAGGVRVLPVALRLPAEAIEQPALLLPRLDLL